MLSNVTAQHSFPANKNSILFFDSLRLSKYRQIGLKIGTVKYIITPPPKEGA